MSQLFYRDGQPVRIPVSPTSGSNQFDLTGLIPNIPDLTFMIVNTNPFDVRLEGTPVNTDFMQVTESTGWPVMGRTVMGPFTSKKPVMLSAQAYATPGQPLPAAGYDYSNCYLTLIYGRGG